MSNAIIQQLDKVIVRELNRATILDGKLFQYYVEQPLNDRDAILSKYFDALSADVYYNDENTNSIYHNVNDAKDFNIHVKSNNVLSAYNIVATNVSATTITAANTTATNVSATNYTATSVSAESLSATSDKFYVNMSSLGQGYTNKMKFVDVVDKLHDRADEVNDIIANNEAKWSSISAIKIVNDSTETTLTPKVLKIDKAPSIDLTYANGRLTIGVHEVQNPATVKNSILVLSYK